MKKKKVIQLEALVAFALILFACNKDADIELHPIDDASEPIINILDSEEALHFRNAINEFNNILTLSDNLLHLDYDNLHNINACESRIKSFITSLNYYNEDVRNGKHITSLHVGVHIMEINSFKSGSLDHPAGAEKDFVYTNHGFIHQFDLTHAGTEWMFAGMYSGSAIITGMFWPVGILTFMETHFNYTHYNLYGNGAGTTIWCYYNPFDFTSKGGCMAQYKNE